MKKIQTVGNLEVRSVGTQTGNSETSLTIKIQEMEKKISGIKDTIEEMNILIKENVKSKKLQT